MLRTVNQGTVTALNMNLDSSKLKLLNHGISCSLQIDKFGLVIQHNPQVFHLVQPQKFRFYFQLLKSSCPSFASPSIAIVHAFLVLNFLSQG